jgi:hypothetical protein
MPGGKSIAKPNGQTPLQQAHCKQAWMFSPSGILSKLSLNSAVKSREFWVLLTAILMPPVQKKRL